MPIGTGIIYNVGDLILGTVSGSGTAFLETKIAAATSSIVYFDSNARINSASLNSITVGTASYVSGSTSIITNLTASNISASGTGSFGMVGIGTTSPNTLLQVHGIDPFVRINNTSNGDHGIKISYGNSDAAGLHLIYNPNDAISYIDNTYPVTAAQVYGDIRFRQNVASTMTTRITIKADGGNVGIGTTSPAVNLEVLGASETLGTIRISGGQTNVLAEGEINSALEFAQRDASVTGLVAGKIASISEFSNGAYAGLGFYTAKQGRVPELKETVRITNNGYVGIGTPSPNDLLQLQASSSTAYDATSDNGQYGSGAGITITNMDETSQSFAQVNLQVSGNAGRAIGRIVAIRTASATSDLAFVTENANTKAEKMRILSDGNLGIGTTAPGAKLEISSSTAASLLNVKGAGGNGLLFVSGSGIVGIGTASPANSKLHIYADHINGHSVLKIQTITSIASGGVPSLGFFDSDGTRNTLLYAASDGTNLANEVNKPIIFSTNSSERMRIDSGGAVGIGTTVPAYKLDVSGDLRISGSGSTVGTFKSSASSCFISLIDSSNDNVFLGNDDGDFLIQTPTTSYSTKLIVKDDGNVGIGTTLPSSRLHVDKSSQTLGSSTPSGATIISNLAGGNAILELGVDTTNLSYIQSRNVTDQTYYKLLLNPSGGSVGIGTTSPTNRFEVVGSTFNRASFIATANVQTGIQIQRTGGVSNTDWEIYSPQSSGDLRIYNGSDYVTFQSGSGNVGIGTTSPSVKLHVDGFFISKTLWSDTAAHSYWGNYSTAYGRLTWDTGLAWINATAGNVLYLGADGANKHVTIATSGNVGIGTTSPDTNLEIYKSVSVAGESYQDILTVTAVDNDGGYFYTGLGAGIAFRSGKTSANVYGPSIMGSIYGANSGDESVANGYLSFHTRNSNTVAERMRIINDGNVGIGTTSPAAKLQVAGNISGSSFTSSISNAVGFLGTSSWAQNVVSASFATTAQTANALNASNNYQVNSIGVGIAGSGTAGRIGTNENGVRSWTITPTGGRLLFESGDANGSAYFVFPVTASTFVGAGTGLTGTAASLTAGTANALNASNTYTIAGLTSAYVDVNGSGTIPTTGIYRPSTKTLGLSADGTLIFKISNVSSPATSSIETGNFIVQTGNVGIGTTSPTINGGGLHVYGSGQKGIRISGNSSNSYSVEIGCDTTKMSYIQTVGTADRGLQLYTGNASTVVMTLTGSNVGIGTTIPGAKLQVDVSSASGIRVNGTGGYANILSQGGHLEFYKDSTPTYAAAIGLSTPATALSNDIQFATYNGSSWSARMTIANGGNVGIGTTSPVARLSVTPSGSAFDSSNTMVAYFAKTTANGYGSTFIRVARSDNTTTTGSNAEYTDIEQNSGGSTPFRYGTYSDTNIINGAAATNGVYGSINFVTSGSTRMTIAGGTSAGNVGIGTTNPGGKLEIRTNDASTYIFSGTSTSGYTTSFTMDDVASYIGHDSSVRSLTLRTNSTDRLTIKGDGNVSIGTTTPDIFARSYNRILGISGSSAAIQINASSGNASYFDMGVAGTRIGGLYTDVNGFEIGTPGAKPLYLFTNGSYKMTINSDGNVGIGASNPSYKLHVYGSSPELVVQDSGANGARVYIKPTNTAVFIGATYASNAVPINFTLNGGSTTSMLIDANSNVGIGVTPTTIVGASGVNGKGLQGDSWTISSLQGTDESYFGNNLYSSAYNVWSNRVNAASGAYYLTGGTHIFLRGAAQPSGSITPTESMRITDTGAVGIGLTNPNTKLQVSGSATIGGYNAFYFGTGVTSLNITAPLYPVLAFYYGTTLAGTVTGYSDHIGLNTGAGGSKYISFEPGDSEIMRITAAGNVGIGTTIPGSLLQVHGANPFVRINNTVGTDHGIKISYGNSDTHGLHLLYNANSAVSYIDNTYPVSAGYVFGDIYFRQNVAGTMTTRMTIKADGGGNVGIGTTNPATKLAVNGVSSFGLSSKLSMIGLDINSGETPTYVKIITTIPVASGAADFTVNIKGFIYGASRNADISISWHYYNSTFYNPIAKSSGGWAPTIRLSAEGGFVAIVLSTPGYWPKFYVESMYSSAYNNQYVSGWSWVDADATGSPIVTVPYASDFGNSFVMLTNGNVGIGTTSPNAKLDVNGSIYLNGNIRNVWGDNLFNVTQYPSNFSTSPSYYMGFQTDATNRIFYISNKDEDGSATDPNGGIIFRTGGTPTNRMLISYTGNVGIGTTSPTTKLYVSGSVTALDGRFISNVTSGTDKYFLDCYGTSTNQIFALYENSNTAYLNSYSSMAFRANQNGGSGGYFVFSGANVGIGTTVPTGQLHLYSSTSTIMKFDRLDTSTFGFEIGGTTFGLYDYTNSEFRWRAFSRNLIINESYGDVGIGTAAPAAKLEISGSSNSALLNIKSPISGAILFVSGSGAVGINTSTVGAYTLQVNGSFAATTKSFIIDHPTKAGKKLIYGSLESPYHGIRLTGRDTLKEGKCKVELPDYIYKLILHDSVNIQLTGIKCNKTLYVDEINIPENYFTIAYDNAIFESYKDYDFFWDFTGIRTDVPELITEL